MRLDRRLALTDIDVALAILGALFSAGLAIGLAMSGYRFIYVVAGAVPSVACIAYLALRTRRSLPLPSSRAEDRPSLYLVLNILFLLLLCYSILALYLRPEVYERPLGYFVSIGLMSAVVAVEILVSPPKKAHVLVAIVKIIIVALSLAWSQQLIFPDVMGSDPWYHQRFTAEMISDGHLPERVQYYRYPIMHLLTGTTSMVADLDYRTASMLSMNLAQVVCDLAFVFLLGRLVHSARAGLLAALMLAVSSNHIGIGFWMTPSYAAITFLPIILYLHFRIVREGQLRMVALSIVAMLALAQTHPLTSMCMAAMLVLSLIGLWMYRRTDPTGTGWKPVPASIAVTALFIIGLSLFWTISSGHMDWIVDRLTGGSDHALVQGGLAPTEDIVAVVESGPTGSSGAGAIELDGSEYMRSLPEWKRLFHQLGVFTFVTLAFVGSLALLSRKLRNENGLAVVLVVFVLIATAFFGLTFRLDILPGRWFLFSLVVAAVPVGVALLSVFGGTRNAMARMPLLGGFVFALTFVMIMIPTANADNPALKSFSTRYALTESELQAIDAALANWNGLIAADADYLYPAAEISGRREVSSIGDSLLSRDFTEHGDSMVVIREYILHDTFRLASYSLWQLDYDPRHELDEQGFSKVYDSGSVSAFTQS
jgi:hypothetical protein